MASVFRTTLKYFMMGCYADCCSPKGLLMSVILVQSSKYAPYAYHQQPGSENARLRDNGAITVICTDKTGTLTQNLMQVHEINFYRIKTAVTVR